LPREISRCGRGWAKRRPVEEEPRVGVGPDQDLVDRVLEDQLLALERAANHRQAGGMGRRIGHLFLGPRHAGASRVTKF
jgi:hypothetical protein